MPAVIVPEPARAPARRRGAGTTLAVVGALLVVAALALAAWAVVALLQVRSAAATATDRVRDVEAGVASGQTSAALAAARSAAASTREAHRHADALPLRLASRLPVVGAPLERSRTLVAATDTAVRLGAVPLLEVADDLAGAGAGGVLRGDGGVDVGRLERAAAVARGAAEATRGAEASAAAIDPASLPGPLAGPAGAAREGIGRLAVTADRADAALGAGPALMGAGGPRSYLVLPGGDGVDGVDGVDGDGTVLVVEDGRARTSTQSSGAGPGAATVDAVLHVEAPTPAQASASATGAATTDGTDGSTTGGGDESTAALLAPLVAAARDGRLSACSRHADLQAALQRSGVSEPGAGEGCR